MPKADQTEHGPNHAGATLRFRRTQRLTLATEFAATYAAKVRKPAGPLMVHAAPNTLGRARLGLSIGRAVGPAVRRNRLKRKLREAFRLEQQNLPAGLDLVISARAHEDLPLTEYRELLVRTAASLEREVARRARRAGEAQGTSRGDA